VKGRAEEAAVMSYFSEPPWKLPKGTEKDHKNAARRTDLAEVKTGTPLPTQICSTSAKYYTMIFCHYYRNAEIKRCTVSEHTVPLNLQLYNFSVYCQLDRDT
jgi:hypothetical protein